MTRNRATTTKRGWTHRQVAAGLSVVLLTGCAVGPKYRKPVIQTPPSFRGADPGQTTATSFADLKWFEIFQDPELQKLNRTALVDNYDVRDAMARVDAARASLGITRADQLPSISASAGVTHLRNSSSGAFPLPAGIEPKRTFGSVLLNLLSFELDVWGRLRRQTEVARAGLAPAKRFKRRWRPPWSEMSPRPISASWNWIWNWRSRGANWRSARILCA